MPLRSSRLAVLFVLLAGLTLPARAQSLEDLTDRSIEVSAFRQTTAGKTTSVEFRSERLEAPLHGVVLRGLSADTALQGWVRFERGGSWGTWHPLYVVFSATGETFLAAYRGDTLLAPARLELRFSLDRSAALELRGVGTFDDSPEPEAEEPSGAPKTGSLFGVEDHITPPRLIRREAWGAEAFRGDPAPLARPNYLYITLHHAAGFGAETLEEGLEQVRRIQDFHQNGRGWSDIGYHFVYDQSGRLYQGRPFQDERRELREAPSLVMGAHAGGANTGNIGLSLLGCYHPPEGPGCRDVITEAALDSVVTMFAFLAERYDVSPDNIMGHRHFSATACPGDNNYPLLGEIRERVRTLLVTGNQPVGRAEIAAEADEEGVVRVDWTFLEDGGVASYRIERAYLDDVTVVYEGTGSAPDHFVDRGVSRPGPVVYRLYASDAQGREQLLAVDEALVRRPEDYLLAGNFPNPFGDRTTIRYYLPQDGVVSLRVYDVAGREVAVLVDEHQEGGRWHHAGFDGRGLSVGTYLFRLRVEGFSGVTFSRARPFTLLPR